MAGLGTLPVSLAAISLCDTSTLATEQTHLQKPNLPLPRELRDQVWGFLLRHEHVHMAPYQECATNARGQISTENERHLSRAHTFKFHTNILAVNRQIHEECSQVLKSNAFVIVSHKAPLVGPEKHMASVPIVTENHGDCARFKAHVLRVHIQGSPRIIKHSQIPDGQRSFIMLACDLSPFCRAVQNVLYFQPFSSPLVTDTDGFPDPTQPMAELEPYAPQQTYIRTHIQFQDDNISVFIARKLLEPFCQIIHGNMRINIANYPQTLTPEVEKLKEVMAPRKIWLKAMAWHIFQTVQDQLAEAKAVAEAGDLEHAVERYAPLRHLIVLSCFFCLPPQFYLTEAGLPIGLLILAILDAAVTEANLRKRLGEFHHPQLPVVAQDLMSVMKLIPTLQGPALKVVLSTPPTGPDGMPAALACSLLCSEMITMREGRVDTAMRNLEALAEPLKGDAYFSHDRALIVDMAGDKHLRASLLKGDGFRPEFALKTSAYQLPVRVFDNPILAMHEPPAGLEGFVDREQVSRLRKKYPGNFTDL